MEYKKNKVKNIFNKYVGLNESKLGYDATITEYVGEFDLVINKRGYYTGSKLNPILNWLNTPI